MRARGAAKTRACLGIRIAARLLLATLAAAPASVAAAEPDPDQRARPGVVGFGRLDAAVGYTHADSGRSAAFTLDRAEFGVGGVLGRAAGGEAGWVAGVEAVRAMAGLSLYGIDGDSLVARVQSAHAFWAPRAGHGAWTLRLGLVPEVWHEALSADQPLRATGASAEEIAGLIGVADLGASARWTSPSGGAVLRLAATNGEGPRQIERNFGKTVSATATLRLWRVALAGAPGRLRLHLGGRYGAEGPNALRAHRALAALTWTHPTAAAGALYARAWGAGGRAEREASATSVWASASPGLRRLQLLARWDRDAFDRTRGGAHVDRWQAGALVDLLDPTAAAAPRRLRLYLLWRGLRSGALAGPAAGVASAGASDGVVLLVEASAMDAHPAPPDEARALGEGP